MNHKFISQISYNRQIWVFELKSFRNLCLSIIYFTLTVVKSKGGYEISNHEPQMRFSPISSCQDKADFTELKEIEKESEEHRLSWTNLPTANTVRATEVPPFWCARSYRFGSNIPSQIMGAFQGVHVCTSPLDLIDKKVESQNQKHNISFSKLLPIHVQLLLPPGQICHRPGLHESQSRQVKRPPSG